MDFPIATTVSAASALASAVAAFASWHAARRANDASRQANATADTVARIERDRRHAELRPELIIETKDPIGSSGVSDYMVLRFRFPGPNELEPHGPLAVKITMRDDQDRSMHHTLPGGITREQVAAQIWGPWRLQPTTDGTDRSGRSCPARSVNVGEDLLCAMERTRSPHSHDGAVEQWERQYRGMPMRLRLDVECEGFEPWVFLEEFHPAPVTNP